MAYLTLTHMFKPTWMDCKRRIAATEVRAPNGTPITIPSVNPLIIQNQSFVTQQRAKPGDAPDGTVVHPQRGNTSASSVIGSPVTQGSHGYWPI